MTQFRIITITTPSNTINGKIESTLNFETHLFAIAQGVFQTLCSRDDTADCRLYACDTSNVLLCTREEWINAARQVRHNAGAGPIIR